MPRPPSFSPSEERSLAQDVREGRQARCPDCDVPLDELAVPPRADVSYVRDRAVLVCPSCHRTAVVDRKGPS